KLKNIRRWMQVVEEALSEYRGHVQPLFTMLDGDFRKAVGTLDRMMIALEDYLATEAPSLESSESTETKEAETPQTPAGQDADQESAQEESAEQESEEQESASVESGQQLAAEQEADSPSDQHPAREPSSSPDAITESPEERTNS
ncbi:MAG: hypothetical protein N2C14_23415, partial [Planctomycetales bacterium]